MKKRDSNGRFTKNNEEGYSHLTLDLPNLKTIIVWILFTLIIFPWILVISKLNIFQKMELIFDNLVKNKVEEESENGKKGGIFY